MMKLLIVNTVPFTLDGINSVILNYYRAMDKNDMQIDFVMITQPYEEIKKEISDNGGKIYVIHGRSRNPLSYVKQLFKIVKDGQYDIVHAHGNSCTLAFEMIAAKIGGARVRIPHSHNSNCKHKAMHTLLKPFFNRYYTHGFACGEKAGEWLYGKRKFTIINNGINLKNYLFSQQTRDMYRKKLNLIDKKVIGHVGNFIPRKNDLFLIDIFAELYKMDSSYRLLTIGDGKLKQEVQEKVAGIGLEEAVIFTGLRDDVPELMQAMDIFVLPSIFEGLPLTLIEAQSAGLPCVVSDKVSNEVKITDLVEFISIDKSAAEWVKRIQIISIVDRKNTSEDIKTKIASAGYSIDDNAKYLKKLYGKISM